MASDALKALINPLETVHSHEGKHYPDTAKHDPSDPTEDVKIIHCHRASL